MPYLRPSATTLPASQSSSSRLPAARSLAIEAATADLGIGAGMANGAGPGDIGHDIGRPADSSFIPENGCKPLDAVDAVLQSDHSGLRSHERACLLAGRLGIPQLYRKEHHV